MLGIDVRTNTLPVMHRPISIERRNRFSKMPTVRAIHHSVSQFDLVFVTSLNSFLPGCHSPRPIIGMNGPFPSVPQRIFHRQLSVFAPRLIEEGHRTVRRTHPHHQRHRISKLLKCFVSGRFCRHFVRIFVGGKSQRGDRDGQLFGVS